MRVLNLAIGGHLVIGCLRLFGFNVFRNTYKPLLAQSLVEFWNRYYYYFKELLVEFFFFPTYVRYFKTRPRLRMLAAIMMAALVGNTYYHVLGSLHTLLQMDRASAWEFVGTRAFYCTFLALGIYVSMVREQGRRGQPAADSRRPLSRDPGRDPKNCGGLVVLRDHHI